MSTPIQTGRPYLILNQNKSQSYISASGSDACDCLAGISSEKCDTWTITKVSGSSSRNINSDDVIQLGRNGQFLTGAGTSIVVGQPSDLTETHWKIEFGDGKGNPNLYDGEPCTLISVAWDNYLPNCMTFSDSRATLNQVAGSDSGTADSEENTMWSFNSN